MRKARKAIDVGECGIHLRLSCAGGREAVAVSVGTAREIEIERILNSGSTRE